MHVQRLALILAAVLSSSALVTAGDSRPDDVTSAVRHTLRRADRLAEQVLSSLRYGRDECNVVARLATNASLLSLRADLSLALASCINEESGTPQKFLACLEEIYEEYAEGLDEVREIHFARLDLCRLTGGGIYDPDLDEDEFVEGVDHPFLPLATGATWVYQLLTSEGLEEITVTVLDETMEIDDIECIVVRDTVTLDGVLVEDTLDWFAQHEDGSVWYMGEIAQNFEDGQLVDLEGSWRAGEDGGQPGMIMLATPTVGTTYRQELLLTEAEDAGTVLALGETVTIGLGTFGNCLVTEDFTPIEPGHVEYKYYAPGVGLILEVNPVTGEALELISFTPGS